MFLFRRSYSEWKLVKLPPDRRTIGSKWVFKRKEDATRMHKEDALQSPVCCSRIFDRNTGARMTRSSRR